MPTTEVEGAIAGLSHRRTIDVTWGDCDAAGIVFRLVDVEHAVRRHLADGIEVKAGAHDHRFLAERGLGAFAEQVGIPILAAIPAHDDIRRKSANYEIIGLPGGEWGGLFEDLARNVAEAPPVLPSPLSHEQLLDLFSSSAVGRDVVLEPATAQDMCGKNAIEKASLEVIYDEV